MMAGRCLAPRRDLVREFWRLVRAGRTVEEAAAGVGVSRTAGRSWFVQAGGMPPVELKSPSGYRLTIADREQIAVGVALDESYRTIGKRIGKSASTVWKELNKNLEHQHYRPRTEVYDIPAPGRPRTAPIRYSPTLSQRRADAAASRPKACKLGTSQRLRTHVQDQLDLRHSPEQIAGRLLVEFPDDEEMRVSHETIYQAIYIQGRGLLRRDLTTCLRTGRALRKPRRRPGERRGRIPNMVLIADRPVEVDEKQVPGHWEGDLITGALNKSAIGTLVERVSGFVQLLHLPVDHGALAVQEAIAATTARLPETLRRTLTWDQGVEMSNHVQIADATGLDIYFCDPHSPWQRGLNENTNGLLRQYFPKGSDLSVFPADYLDYVALQLNTRPRKRHGFKTPAEVLDQILSGSRPTGVSLAG
jgi:IS30 family transposase